MAGGERILDPEARLQHAREIAWRSLNRRDRTEAEVRGKLADARVAPAVVEAVCAELREGGYLDDAGYARRFAEDKRRLEAWGGDRIAQRLRALGVAREHVDAALAERGGGEELAAAVALLERRFPGLGEDEGDPRDRERALGLLARKGYEAELAYDAIRRHAGAGLDG